eukprot:jgi/Picre1/32589/NNA_007935.t1
MATIAGHGRQEEGTAGKSSILCKYYMNGACSRGEACSFSHDPCNCTQYGLHALVTRALGNGVASQGYEAPLGVPRPDTDSLEDVLPISKLRISRHRGVDQGEGNDESAEEDTVPVVTLPADPFGSDECKTTVTVLDSGVYEGADDAYDESSGHKLEGMCAVNSFQGGYAGSNANTTGGCSSDGNPHSSLSTSPHFNAWGLDGDGAWEDMDQGVQAWLAHGLWCEICENYALHPSDESEAQKHVVECKARHDRLLKRIQSAHVSAAFVLKKSLKKLAVIINSDC